MSRVDLRILLTGDDASRLLLDLFETKSVGTGMTRKIPGGATIKFVCTPSDGLGQKDVALVLIMALSVASGADANAISDWFRWKAAKRPNAKVIVQQRECRFDDGELKTLMGE